jgi:ferredoxin
VNPGSNPPQRVLIEVVVDHDLCVGAGICIATHPTLFRFGDSGHAAYVGEQLDEAAAFEAAELCPMSAIRLVYQD